MICHNLNNKESGFINDRKLKVGFVFFNHIGHIYHSAPVAFELSYNKHFDVTFVVSSEEIAGVLRRIWNLYPNNKCKIRIMKPGIFYGILRIIRRMQLFGHRRNRKQYPKANDMLRVNYQYVMSFDALVTSTDNLHYIMEKRKNIQRDIKLITIFHGMEPFYRLSSELRYIGYDFYLLAGSFGYNYLLKRGIATKENAKIVGYPKFDIALQSEKKSFFTDNKPVVVYTPHWNQELSSWDKWGIQILEIFLNNEDFNLIFAPHIMTSKKDMTIPDEFYSASNIILDLDSLALVDMTYMNNADIYLGDVSSQINEFVVKPRPCVFLNPGGLDWKNIEGMELWNLGEVVDNIRDVKKAISNAKEEHDNYKTIQIEFLNERYTSSKLSGGKRGAKAILEFLIKS